MMLKTAKQLTGCAFQHILFQGEEVKAAIGAKQRRKLGEQPVQDLSPILAPSPGSLQAALVSHLQAQHKPIDSQQQPKAQRRPRRILSRRKAG